MPAPPPPPPPGLDLAPTVLIKYRPKTAVRKIHFQNVSAAGYSNSVWSTLAKNHSQFEDQIQKSGLFDEIDIAFEVKDKKSAKTIDLPSTNPAKFLGEKRAQNVMLFLRSLRKINRDELVIAVRTFDESNLTDTVMNECVAALPTPTEEKILYGLEINSNMRESEQFMIRVESN
jgi:hypothetical protein